MYFNVRSGYDVITDPNKGTFGELGDLGVDVPYVYEHVDSGGDFRAAADAAGIDVTDTSTYETYYYGVGHQPDRDLLRSNRNAVGWAPAFEWSKDYGHWWESGHGYRFGLVYRKDGLPVEYRPQPQTAAQGGGYLQKMPDGTTVRQCYAVVVLPDGSTGPTVVGPTVAADQPCPAGHGGCPADKPCGTGGAGAAPRFVAKLPSKSVAHFSLCPAGSAMDASGRCVPAIYKTGGAAGTPWYRSKWTWIVGGVVIVGGCIAIAVSRSRR